MKFTIITLAIAATCFGGVARAYSDDVPPELTALNLSIQHMTHAFIATDEALPDTFNPIWLGWKMNALEAAYQGGTASTIKDLETQYRRMAQEGLDAVFAMYPVHRITIQEHGIDSTTPPTVRALPGMRTVSLIYWINNSGKNATVWVGNVQSDGADLAGYTMDVPAGGRIVTFQLITPKTPMEGPLAVPIAVGAAKDETIYSGVLEWPVTVYAPATINLSLMEDGQPLVARVAVTDEQRKAWAPLPDEALRGGGTLGQRAWGAYIGDEERWAYADGDITLTVPGGEEVTIKVSRGPEYKPLSVPVRLAPGEQRTMTLQLKRWSNMRERGYYPGDTHVHHLPPETGLVEANGEDIAVVNLLVTEWGGQGQSGTVADWTDLDEYFVGARPHPVSTDNTIVHIGEEYRNHLFGHLIFLNLKELVLPASSGKLPEHWPEDDNAPSNTRASRGVQKQGGLVISPHFRTTHYEAPAQAALGALDSVDILSLTDPEWKRTPQDKSPLDWYYGFLNCGARIAVTAGTDKMSKRVPVGFNRVYVKLDGPFTLGNWIDGIREGRTFVTNGPMLELRVDGQEPGAVLKRELGDVTRVTATAASFYPMNHLELIVNGQVVETVDSDEGARDLSLDCEIPVDGPLWVALRARGNKRFMHGTQGYPLWSHTSPVYVEAPGTLPGVEDARYFADVTRDLMKTIEDEEFRSAKAKRKVIKDLSKAEKVYEGIFE